VSPPRVIKLQTGQPVVDQILRASRERAVLDCGGEGTQAKIDADDVRRACAADRAPERDPFGLRIANAVVEGSVDLSAFQLGEPLHFLGCTFTEAAVFEGADLHELVFTGGQNWGYEGFGEWPKCQLPGLLANGVRIRRDLVLSGSLITGAHYAPAFIRQSAAIWLAEATVGGRLLAMGTQVLTNADRAILADRASFGGAVRLVGGFRASSQIRLLGASIGGSLDLTGANLEPHDGRALDLTESTIGSLFLIDDRSSSQRLNVHGRIELGHMTVRGKVLIRGADLRAPEPGEGFRVYTEAEENVRVAINGPGMTVNGRFSVEGSVVVNGAVLLPRSTLLGGVSLDGASLISPESVALDLSQSKISAGISMKHSLVHGLVDLGDANILGSIDLYGTVLKYPPQRRCVRGVGLRVSGDVNFAQVRASGGNLYFRSAVIDGVVDAEGAVLINEGHTTLSLHQARVGGNVRLCNGFSSKGLVVLNRTVVEGRLRCDGGSFSWTPAENSTASTAQPDAPLYSVISMARDEKPHDESLEPNLRGSAFEAISATFRSGIGLGWTVTSGAIDLTDAKTSYLADDPETDWPSAAYLSGFTYERFGSLDMTQGVGVWNPRARAAWLTRVSPGDPRPWEQAARVLRSNGDTSGADQLLIAQRRLMRHQGDVHGWFPKVVDGVKRFVNRMYVFNGWGPKVVDGVKRFVDRMKDFTVRYGYRPQRALGWLTLLIIIVTVGLIPSASHELLRASDATGLVYSPSGLIAGQTPTKHTSGLIAGQTQTNPKPPTGPCGGGRVRCFDSVLFAVDTVVPIIDLKQRATWYPSHTGTGNLLDWMLNLCTVLGWVLTSIFVLSLARPGRGSA
jgi:hypothetical protein